MKQLKRVRYQGKEIGDFYPQVGSTLETEYGSLLVEQMDYIEVRGGVIKTVMRVLNGGPVSEFCEFICERPTSEQESHNAPLAPPLL